LKINKNFIKESREKKNWKNKDIIGKKIIYNKLELNDEIWNK
jgi:hypothetical protein